MPSIKFLALTGSHRNTYAFSEDGFLFAILDAIPRALGQGLQNHVRFLPAMSPHSYPFLPKSPGAVWL